MRICVGDLEADGLLDVATRVWCGVFKDTRTQQVWKFRPDEIPQMLAFLDTVDILAMHNGVDYDWPLLKKLYNYDYPGAKIDTVLMSRLQRPNRQRPFGCTAGPHSVEAWGSRFGRKKPEHEDWSQFSEDMLHRCTEDVEIQHMILDTLLDEGRGYDWKDAHKLTRELFEVLQLQEDYGWLVDREHMDLCLSLLTHWMDRIERLVTPSLPWLCVMPKKVKGELYYVKKPFLKSGKYNQWTLRDVHEWGMDPESRPVVGPYSRVEFRQVKLGSGEEVKRFLLDLGWIPAKWNTNDAGETTSPKLDKDDPFDGVDSTVGKLIAKWIQCRHRRSQIEGWVKVIRPDGRISQGIAGIATTGRLKHKRIVNVPGGDAFFGDMMRKIFTSKDGYKIVGVDSAGCQNRMLAARVGDPNFTEILINGDKDKGTSIHQVNQKSIAKYAGFEPTYKVSKNLNYAFMFGAQDPKLASTAGVRKELGAKIREGLLAVSPGFKDLVESLEAEWEATAKVRQGKYGTERYGGWITGLDGRPIMIEHRHTILVFMLQSDEAIMMQYALVFLKRWLDELGWVHGREYGFCANIHDEFQAEVRDDLVEQYAELAEESIAYAGRYLNIACPHEGQADIGNNWKETH